MPVVSGVAPYSVAPGAVAVPPVVAGAVEAGAGVLSENPGAVSAVVAAGVRLYPYPPPVVLP